MGIFDKLFGEKRPARDENEGAAPLKGKPSRAGPPKCPGNPGIAASGQVAFANGERSWTESFDLVRIAADVLRKSGHEVVAHEGWLELRPSGFALQPLLVEMTPLDKGGVRTVTTIDVRHPELIRDGLFEFQHSIGDDLVSSLAGGIEGWESVDLPVLLDALRPKPEKCGVWMMQFSAKDGRPARVRRAVLGGVTYLPAQPPAPTTATCAEGEGGECEHSFCPCCFLTRNFEAFRSQIEGDGAFGIRFFAMRDERGEPGADCRINGEDFAPGREALRAYVATWPGTGVEFRKQYVFLHTSSLHTSSRSPRNPSEDYA